MTDRTIEIEENWLTAVGGVGGPLTIQGQLAPGNPQKYENCAPTVGGIFWTGKPKSLVRDTNRGRLNSSYGPKNNRKRRPWIIIEELPDGCVRLMSSTAQGHKGWDAVAKENKQFFLPISPTASNGRPVLEMKVDFEERFVGENLLYFCIEVDILASELRSDKCMGYLDQSAVEIILRERRHIHEVERAARRGNMQEERVPRNISRRPVNLANSRGYPDGHRIHESSFSQNFPSYSSPPLRLEFQNGSNTRSSGRPNGARSRIPIRSSRARANFSHAPSQLGYLKARENRDPDENYINRQSPNPYLNNWSQDRPQPNRSPHQARIHGRDQNPPLRRIDRPQTYTIGRSWF